MNSRPAVVHLYGIRHHGPGSARAVQRALEFAQPDIVLIEGPREADTIAHLALDPQMRPPVTMLGYTPDHPEHAVFFPYASFSPEWVALRWAGDADIPVRHIDLGVAHTLAPGSDAGEQLLFPGGGTHAERPLDPLAVLAEVAGYDDAERWWEDVVEHRDGTSPFAAIADAMHVLRAVYEPDFVPADITERRREAQMRTGIRTAIRDGFSTIAVVCGAWHVPALATATNPGSARADAALLRGMPKVKAAITWVPWTHRRLATATGYGAGVTSPGWYHHLFSHPGPDTIARWFTESARVLRANGWATSAADVVEATRLATSLAGLRGRPLAGLAEVDDAARAVLGDGTDTPMRLLHAELIVGMQIGRVPERTPMVPLARSLAVEQKRCRLKPQAAPKTLELDLRRALDLERSRLLHRLALLRIPWGRLIDGRRSAGTFRETWQLLWEPELEVRIIESSGLGTTIASAADSAVVQGAAGAQSLAELTGAVETCLLANLAAPLATVVAMVADRAAVDADIAHLMVALPALARTVRYGDVRGTDGEALANVLHGMVVRIAAGLLPACVGLGDETAREMGRHIDDTRAALALFGASDVTAVFQRALRELVERERVPAVLQGQATRLLADGGLLGPDHVERRVARALSPGTAAADGAGFVEGFLGGSGTVLVHDAELLGVIDAWLATLDSDAFVAALPLLRRTFATFESSERRQIGDRIRTGAAAALAHAADELDPERVAAGLHTMAILLGAVPR